MTIKTTAELSTPHYLFTKETYSHSILHYHNQRTLCLNLEIKILILAPELSG